MTSEQIKEIEQASKDWFANQPMGSAARQNGPAAMIGFIAGVEFYSNNRLEWELREYIDKKYNTSITEAKAQMNQIKKVKKSNIGIE